MSWFVGEHRRFVRALHPADWPKARQGSPALWLRMALFGLLKLAFLFIIIAASFLCFIWLLSVKETHDYGFFGGLLHGTLMPGYVAQHLFWPSHMMIAPLHHGGYFWGYALGLIMWLYVFALSYFRTLVFDVARRAVRQHDRVVVNDVTNHPAMSADELEAYINTTVNPLLHTDLERRVVKVFISSTFQDMQRERDYLMTHIFPRLVHEARLRGVLLLPVDLRWGITEEESRSGKVLEICLQEIDNASPFFIGILGDRYGWCPTGEELDRNPRLSRRFPWMADDIASGLSVTEMEIQYGTLRRNKTVNAAFYFKGTAYSNNWFDKLLANADAMTDDKLTLLRRKIYDDHRYPVTTYSEVEQLGDAVERDMRAYLDRYFPLGELNEKELRGLELQDRCLRLCEDYMVVDANFDALDNFWSDADARTLLIEGAEGSGRTAMVVNWLKNRGLLDDNAWLHDAGGSGTLVGEGAFVSDSLVWLHPMSFDNGSHSFVDDFPQILEAHFESSRPKLIVYSHGSLNKGKPLDSDALKVIGMLGDERFADTKLIFTDNGDWLAALDGIANVWHHQMLMPDKECRADFVTAYLARFCKKLQPHQVNRIATWAEHQTMQSLKLLLHDLVLFGSYEELDDRITYLTSANSAEELCSLLLQGFEKQYGRKLVAYTLGYAALSPQGLPEEQLVLLGNSGHFSVAFDETQVRRFVRNCIALEHAHGRVALVDAAMLSAVNQRYLPDEKKRSKMLRRYRFWLD